LAQIILKERGFKIGEALAQGEITAKLAKE
jgi:hypothetical protein